MVNAGKQGDTHIYYNYLLTFTSKLHTEADL